MTAECLKCEQRRMSPVLIIPEKLKGILSQLHNRDDKTETTNPGDGQ